jgi:hypothetical protein
LHLKSLARIGRGLNRGCLVQEFLFAENEGIDVISRELESMAMGYGVGGASLDTIAAENTPGVIDVVHAGITVTGGHLLGRSIFGSLNIDALCRTCRSAQEASHALLESVFVAVEHVDAAVASLEMNALVRIVFSRRLPPHVAERHAKASDNRDECLSDFGEYGRHFS